MLNTRFSFACVAALVVIFTFSGCGGGTKSGGDSTGSSGGKTGDARKAFKAQPGAQLKLAFVSNNPSEFWKIAVKGLEKFEKEKGIKVDFKAPANGKVEEQIKILEDLVTQGYNGIAVSVIAGEDEVRDINKACERTNVVCHDSDAPKSKRIAYIGTNNYEAGKELGKTIKKILPDGGKMAVFVGTLAADNASQRLKGIEDEIKGTKIEIVAKKEDNKDTTKARSNVEDVITSHPDIALLVGLWSYNTPAILSAVKASKKEGKIKIAGFDEEVETLEGIEQGYIDGTVVQKPFEFGYRSAMLLHELATKGEEALPKDPIVDTGVETITKDNVKAFKEKLAELKK